MAAAAAAAAEPRERKYDLDPEAEETIGDVASQNALDLERVERGREESFQDFEEDGGGGGGGGADFASFGGSRGPASVFGDGPSGGGGGGGGQGRLQRCFPTVYHYKIYTYILVN